MTTPNKEICKSCLWKKQVSVYKWDQIAHADFIWDKTYMVKKGWIEMVNCSRCNGTGYEHIEPKTPNRQEMISRIMEEMSDTNLDFWCKFQICKWGRVRTYICMDRYWREWLYNDEHNLVTKQSDKIDTDKLYSIYHPIYLHNLLIRLDKNWHTTLTLTDWAIVIDQEIEIQRDLEKDLSNQSDLVVEQIYSLISNNGKK